MPKSGPTTARIVLLLLTCAAIWVPARIRGQSLSNASPAVELDLAAYKSELDRCAEAIHHPDEIPALRRSLPSAWLVRHGESQMKVRTEWLTADLVRIEQNPQKAKATQHEVELRLTAMRNAAAELQDTTAQAGPDQARARLEQILQRREFAGATGPSQFQILLAKIERWIEERLISLLTRLHFGGKVGNFIVWAVVIFAFLVLLYWVWLALSEVRRHTAMPVAGPGPADGSRVWVADALAAAERGDYREAVHCAYWAAIVRLESLGLLKRDRARTPRESLRLLEPHPNEQKLLGDFTRHFELIWYGYRPASRADWSGARDHLEKMGCLTPSTPATANS